MGITAPVRKPFITTYDCARRDAHQADLPVFSWLLAEAKRERPCEVALEGAPQGEAWGPRMTATLRQSLARFGIALRVTAYDPR